MIHSFRLKSKLTFLSVCLALTASCSTTQKSSAPAKLSRDYWIDIDAAHGLIYGKIVHNQAFGKKFTIVLKSPVTQKNFQYNCGVIFIGFGR